MGFSDTKILYLIRGVPGTGKSHLAKKLRGITGTNIDGDSFFMKDGVFQFDPAKEDEAKQWMTGRADKSMGLEANPVIVNDTLGKTEEMKPYAELAAKHGYEVRILEPAWDHRLKTPEGKWNHEFLKGRSLHGVDDKMLQKMIDDYEYNISVEDLMSDVKKEAAIRTNVSVSCLINELDPELIKEGAELPDISTVPSEVVSYSLCNDNMGKFAAILVHRACGNKWYKAANTQKEILQTYSDGLALEEQIIELRGMMKSEVTKTASKLLLDDTQLMVKVAHEIMWGVMKVGEHGTMDKQAAISMLTTANYALDQSKEASIRREVFRAYPQLRLAYHKQAMAKAASRKKELRTASGKTPKLIKIAGKSKDLLLDISDLPKAMATIGTLATSEQYPVVKKAAMTVFYEYPEIHKELNINTLQKAASAALYRGDRYSLAICVVGLAASGVFGDKAKEIVCC